MSDINPVIIIGFVLQLILFVIMCFREGAKTTDFLLLAIITLLGAFYEQNRETICLLENFPK